MRSAGFGLAAWSFALFPLLGSGDNRVDHPRSGRRPRPARRDVRAAGGDDHRTVPDPDPLFGRVDRLSADLDLRRLAGADHRLVALPGVPARRCRWRSMSASPARSAASPPCWRARRRAWSWRRSARHPETRLDAGARGARRNEPVAPCASASQRPPGRRSATACWKPLAQSRTAREVEPAARTQAVSYRSASEISEIPVVGVAA